MPPRFYDYARLVWLGSRANLARIMQFWKRNYESSNTDNDTPSMLLYILGKHYGNNSFSLSVTEVTN